MNTSIKGILTTSVVAAGVLAAAVGAAPLALADSEAGNPETTTGASVTIEEAASQTEASQIVTEAAQDMSATDNTKQGTAHNVVAPAALNSTSVGNKTQQVSPNRIDTSSKAAVAKAYKEMYVSNNRQIKPASGADVYSCTPGKVNDQAATMVVNSWNFFRGLNNLDAVSIDPASPLSHYMQKAALTQAAQNIYGTSRGLSHNPSHAGFKCSDDDANAGSGHANLAQANAFTTGEQILWWYQDWSGYRISTMEKDGFNDRLGHRNWLMDPYIHETGYGNVEGFNALAVATGGNFGDYDEARMKNPNATTPETMAWPSAGYFPAELLTSASNQDRILDDVERWSFRVMGADMSAAKVTVTGPKGNVPVRVVNTGKYAPRNISGYGTVLFKMTHEDVHPPKGTNVDTYTVRVTGVKGTSQSSYYYQVKLFNADATAAKPTIDIIRNPIAVAGSASVPARVHATGAYNKYQWQISKDQGKTWEDAARHEKLNTNGISQHPDDLSWAPMTNVCKAPSGKWNPCPLTDQQSENYRFRVRATNKYGTTYSEALKVDVIKFVNPITSVKKGETLKGLKLNTKGNADYVTVGKDTYFYKGDRYLTTNSLDTSTVKGNEVSAKITVRIWDSQRQYTFYPTQTITLR